jgi:hypothetical protein
MAVVSANRPPQWTPLAAEDSDAAREGIPLDPFSTRSQTK